MPTDYYEARFHRQVQTDASLVAAVEHTATAYLDGKPALQGKHKVTRAQRHTAFWSSSFLSNLPAATWQSQTMMLALAQYMGQEHVSNGEMLASVASAAPDVLIRAVRCSGLVLTQHSPRRTELDQFAVDHPGIAELHPWGQVLQSLVYQTLLLISRGELHSNQPLPNRI